MKHTYLLVFPRNIFFKTQSLITMDNIIKSFHFEAENIKLTLNIKKEIYRDGLKMFIDANVTTNNINVKKVESVNGSSKNISLNYKNKPFFWISSNDWKGLRWDKYSNETGYEIYYNVTQMKERYIVQREYIPKIAEYFYNSIKIFKETKMLYETRLEDIIYENN